MNHHIIRPYIPRVDLEAIARSIPLDQAGTSNASSESPKDQVLKTPENPSVIIQPTTDFWRVSGVEYRDGIHTFDLSKSLLDGGKGRTQDEWAKNYEDVKDKGGFYTPDYPLLYGLVKAVHSLGNNSGNSDKDEIQEFIKDSSRANWLMTLTRIAYTSKKMDKIIHNYGTGDIYNEDVDFITPDEYITKTAKPASYQKLLGTKDSVGGINEVFKWLNGTDTFAWKLNSKPKETKERVAGFDACSGWVDLYCCRNPTIAFASLGVRSARSAPSAKNLRRN